MERSTRSGQVYKRKSTVLNEPMPKRARIDTSTGTSKLTKSNGSNSQPDNAQKDVAANSVRFLIISRIYLNFSFSSFLKINFSIEYSFSIEKK